MNLAIVGSTRPSDTFQAAKYIHEMLERYKPDVIVSGGAAGIDTLAEIAAKQEEIARAIFYPAVGEWSQGFKPRNLRIAEYCDVLVRIANKNTTTYGSGWTRDRAAELGKPTEEFLLP